jgi:hypothetical protein
MKEVGRDENVTNEYCKTSNAKPYSEKKFVKEGKRFYCYEVRDITKLTLRRCNI